MTLKPAAGLLLVAMLGGWTGCTSSPQASNAPRPTTTTSTTPSTATTATTSTTTGSPSEGFTPDDATWVSTEHGWVLGSTAVLETRDGGRSWAHQAAPGGSVTAIRFANEQIGWAFGPSFQVTTDGGRTWAKEPAPAVAALEAARGRVVRVVTDQPESDCLPHCSYRLEQAAVGSNSWQPLPVPPLDGGWARLMLEGPRIYVLALHNPAGGAEDARSSFVRSLDGGRTWRSLADPCSDASEEEHDAFSLAAAPGGFVTVLCHRRAGSAPSVVVSTDGGTTWSSRRPFPDGIQPSAIAAGSARAISVWAAGSGMSKHILTSHDAGRSWTTTLTIERPDGPTGSLFLGYQDRDTGRAFDGGGEIWTTRDAGNSWAANRVEVPGGS